MTHKLPVKVVDIGEGTNRRRLSLWEYIVDRITLLTLSEPEPSPPYIGAI